MLVTVHVRRDVGSDMCAEKCHLRRGFEFVGRIAKRSEKVGGSARGSTGGLRGFNFIDLNSLI